MDKIKTYIVDRFESDYVVLEAPDGKTINIKKDKILQNVSEGDCLIYKDERFLLDEKTTKERRLEIVEKMKRMWEN